MAISKITNKGLGAGTVLQVVQTFDSSGSTYFSTATTGTMLATGFSVTITPSSASSKILLLVNSSMYNSGSSANYTATIYRNSTNLSTGGGAVAGFNASYVNGSLNLGTPVNMSVLDSPATTSAVTYQVYVAGNSGTTYFGVAPAFTTSRVLSFIAMEIAA